MVRIQGGELIRRFEQGAVEPNARMIVTLAEALGVDAVALLVRPHGNELKALRLASGRSPADMAAAVHVSVHSYLEWEAGQNLPLYNDRILTQLTDTLRCSRDDILTALDNAAAPDPHPVAQPGDASTGP